MGTSWITGLTQMFRQVQVNDTAIIDFTFYDLAGHPILTSSQKIHQVSLGRGGGSFLAEPLSIRAGWIGNPPYTGVDAYFSDPRTMTKFGIHGLELDELDAAVLGMQVGETKTVGFTFSDPLKITFKDYEFNAIGGNFSNSALGDPVPFGFSVSPLVEGLDTDMSTPTDPVFRIGYIVNKTTDSVEVQHRYPSAEITVREIRAEIKA